MIQVHKLVCENIWIIEVHGATIKVMLSFGLPVNFCSYAYLLRWRMSFVAGRYQCSAVTGKLTRQKLHPATLPMRCCHREADTSETAPSYVTNAVLSRGSWHVRNCTQLRYQCSAVTGKLTRQKLHPATLPMRCCHGEADTSETAPSYVTNAVLSQGSWHVRNCTQLRYARTHSHTHRLLQFLSDVIGMGNKTRFMLLK
jgi:hypothetical protein